MYPTNSNQVFLLLLTSALVVGFLYVFRFHEVLGKKIAELKNDEKSIEYYIDLVRMSFQASGVIGVGFAAVLSWQEFWLSNQKELHLDTASLVIEIMEKFSNGEVLDMAAALLAMEELAEIQPEKYSALVMTMSDAAQRALLGGCNSAGEELCLLNRAVIGDVRQRQLNLSQVNSGNDAMISSDLSQNAD